MHFLNGSLTFSTFIQVGRGKSDAMPSTSKDHELNNIETSIQECTQSTVKMMKCTTCNVYVKKRYFSNHVNSHLHKNNLFKLKHSLENVNIIETAFKDRLLTYRIGTNSSKDCTTPELYFSSINDSVVQILSECKKQFTTFKVNFILRGSFIQQTKDLKNSFDFQTSNYIVCMSTDNNELIASVNSTLTHKISEFERKDSGWSLQHLSELDINVGKFKPCRGTSFIELPHDIRSKKAVINVKNTDVLCFKWAVLSALYPAQNHSDRVTAYSQHSNKLKFNKITFPVKLCDISKF